MIVVPSPLPPLPPLRLKLQIDLKNSISGRSDSTGLFNTGTCIVGDVVSEGCSIEILSLS